MYEPEPSGGGGPVRGGGGDGSGDDLGSDFAGDDGCQSGSHGGAVWGWLIVAAAAALGLIWRRRRDEEA